MGALARVINRAGSFLPAERKTNIGAMVPAWEEGVPQQPRHWHNYYRMALEGYSRNEIVYACVEEIATSAAEPRLVGVRKTANGTEQVKDHPILDLFERPNPFTSRYALIASLMMYRAVAGNAYLHKERSAAGKVVELWTLRPDRMFVIPDTVKHIAGWEYRLGNATPMGLAAEDVLQFKTRNLLDDWYGLPPLAVCAERVDTDSMMRAFTNSFFRNAGVPAGLLQITKQVTAAERQVIRDRFRGELGGPAGWHQLLVLDDTEAHYSAMGLPLGQSGIVLPELDEISEARIAMAFGVPLELIGARLGMVHGNRSTTLAARAGFWDETMAPAYQELAADLTSFFIPGEYDDLDYLEFDLSTVKALQEDDDAKHKRLREDLASGGISVQEFREATGREPEYAPDALLMLGSRIQPMTAKVAIEGAPAQEAAGAVPGGVPATQPAPNGNGNGNGHGKMTTADLAMLKELAAGRDV